MADANDIEFVKRLQKVEERHRRLARGHVRLKEVDGLLIPVPARRPARRTFPFVGLLMTISALTGFKGFLLFHHGPTTYAQNVDLLASGNVVEKLGAWIMSADPATIWVAQQFAVLPGLWGRLW